MSGLNKVIIIGHLGKDPEVRDVNGQSVANFSVATSKEWTDKNGEKQKKTEWHKVQAWGKLADLAGKYLSKGRQACIEGELATRKWTDKDGVDRYVTEIVAKNIVFVGSNGDRQSQAQTDDQAPPREPARPRQQDMGLDGQDKRLPAGHEPVDDYSMPGDDEYSF